MNVHHIPTTPLDQSSRGCGVPGKGMNTHPNLLAAPSIGSLNTTNLEREAYAIGVS